MLRSMSPPRRDRLLQINLAAARGPQRNFRLLCQATDALAPVRRARLAESRGHEMTNPSFLALVAKLSRDLDAEGIPNALTGSVAAAVHGEPVTSLDVDIVVNMTPESALRIARRWRADLNADEHSFRLAAEEHGIATMLHMPSGLKIDISNLRDTPYYREVMQRRMRFVPEGATEELWVVTPEDLILMKLLWYQGLPSEKQWRQAVGIAQIKGRNLDWKYIRYWTHELNLDEELANLVREAGL